MQPAPRLMLVGAVLLTSCSLFEDQVSLAGATLGAALDDGPYPLRHGLREDDGDTIASPGDWLTVDRWCFRAGAELRLAFTIRDDGSLWAYRTSVTLIETDGEAIVRTHVIERDGAAALEPAQVRVSLPEGIGIYTLEIDLTVRRGAGREWRKVASFPRRITVYAVFGPPTPPMAGLRPGQRPWVSVLETSCRWAKGERSPEAAARKLTQTLHGKSLYQDGHAFTLDFGAGAAWRQQFFLKDFQDDPRFPRGQCDDLANFLLVMLSSLGVEGVAVERSGSPNGPGLWSNRITLAGASRAGRSFFLYHQFVVVDDATAPRVLDPSLVFEDGSSPAFVSRDREYKSRLVALAQTSKGDPWRPSAPFLPEVSASPQPP